MGDFRRQLNVFLLSLLLLLCACSPFNPKNKPIILILLDSFSEQDYLCGDEQAIDDLNNLLSECEQFTRFSHVYAPTPLIQPNIATLFTGLDVQKHGVTHNGPVSIPAELKTLAEKAHAKGMRTALFSGGPPLQQKFGGSQGFEKVSEGFLEKRPKVFVPFRQTIERGLSWLDGEVGKSPFFMTIYAPDLAVPLNSLGVGEFDEVVTNRAEKLHEINEGFDFLIAQLKKRNLWKSSRLLIMGTTGAGATIRPINPLGGHHLHVPVQVKQKQGEDESLKKYSSQLLSFTDISQWIESWLDPKVDISKRASKNNKFIPHLSYLNKWLGISNWSALGLRKKQYLFVFDPALQVYDSFLDKKEIDPMDRFEAERISKEVDIIGSMKGFFPGKCYGDLVSRNCPPKQQNVELLQDLARLVRWSENSVELFSNSESLNSTIKQAIETARPTVINWLAMQSLYREQWTNLFELGKVIRNEAWMLLAQINLRENLVSKPEGCLGYFVGDRKPVSDFYKKCQDSRLRRVIDGISKLRNKQLPDKAFWEEVEQIKSMRLAKSLNLKMYFVNDVKNPFDFSPDFSELYFFLPENSKYQKLIKIN